MLFRKLLKNFKVIFYPFSINYRFFPRTKTYVKFREMTFFKDIQLKTLFLLKHLLTRCKAISAKL